MSLNDNVNIDQGITGGTGGTGGAGSPPFTTESTMPLQDRLKFLNNSGQTVEDFAKAAAYEGLVGATGGVGDRPNESTECSSNGSIW